MGQSSLVLGTAQLGMTYGIANSTGKPSLNESIQIIKIACEGGVRFIDTAQGYGDSELIIGKTLDSLGLNSSVKILSKLDPCLEYYNETALNLAIDNSLSRLQVPYLWALSLHRQEDLHEKRWSTLEPILLKIKEKGLIKNIGVSLYDLDWAWQALKYENISY